MSKMPPAPTPTPGPGGTPPHGKKAREASKLAAFLGYLVRGRRRPGEVTIISHSDLFYWWPVWLIGFIMSGVTYFHGVHAAFVAGDPPHVVTFKEKVTFKDLDETKPGEAKVYEREGGQAIIPAEPAATHPFPTTKHGGEDKYTWPLMHNSKNPGVIFIITLLLVIVITNVHLRGLWSLIVIIVILMGTIIFALAGWWEEILSRGRLLGIHINMGAYFFFSLVLFIVWLINFGLFDRQRYVAVTPGQVRLHLAIGEGEIVYDTMGLVFQKQRSDLFRHWILGFGSGDLIIRPAGGKDPIDLPNVLFVGSKVQEIQSLIKEKEVVAT